jgi:hypothetical protein
MSRNVAYSLPHLWGGRNCILPIKGEQLNTIRVLKEALGGERLIAFTSEEFSDQAQTVYEGLNIHELTSKNVWHVFHAMYLVLFP